jgi:hypothetical protein
MPDDGSPKPEWPQLAQPDVLLGPSRPGDSGRQQGLLARDGDDAAMVDLYGLLPPLGRSEELSLPRLAGVMAYWRRILSIGLPLASSSISLSK